MEQDFKQWFKWAITIKRKVGRDMYGQNIYAYDTTGYPCFLQRTRKLILDRTAEQTISELQIFIDRDVNVSVDDIIVLPDGKEVRVLKVEELPDENGQIHHKVVYC